MRILSRSQPQVFTVKSLMSLLQQMVQAIQTVYRPNTEVEQTEAQQEWEAEILAAEETKKVLTLNKLQGTIPGLIERLKPVTSAKVDEYYLNLLKTRALESMQAEALSARVFIDLYQHAIKPRLTEGEALARAEDAVTWIQRLDGFSIAEMQSDFLDEVIVLLTRLLSVESAN